MALQFVKTSVLSSEDGIGFSKEETVESDEAKQIRLTTERAAIKPLYEQLAEQKEKKQQEYDANTKLMFAPPKALDDEEYSFLQSIQETQLRKQEQRFNEEQRAIEEFKANLRSDDSEKPKVSTLRLGITSSEESLKPKLNVTSIIKVKRKIDSNEKNEPNSKEPKIETNKQQETKVLTIETSNESNVSSNTMSLFADYGSDEEEEE